MKYWLLQLGRIFLITFAITMVSFSYTYAQDLSTPRIDEFGNMILGRARFIAYWVIAIYGTIDIAKKATSKDRHGVVDALIFYFIVFGAMYALPAGLNMIREMFS